jgi:hypothetical protein
MLFTDRAMWFVPRTPIPTARSQPVNAAGDMEHATAVHGARSLMPWVANEIVGRQPCWTLQDVDSQIH